MLMPAFSTLMEQPEIDRNQLIKWLLQIIYKLVTQIKVETLNGAFKLANSSEKVHFKNATAVAAKHHRSQPSLVFRVNTLRKALSAEQDRVEPTMAVLPPIGQFS